MTNVTHKLAAKPLYRVTFNTLFFEVFCLLVFLIQIGKKLPHLSNVPEHVGSEFVSFLLAFIEEPPETDSDDIIPDTFLRVVLSYNLQFPLHSTANLVLEALARRNNAKVFTEKILLLINREGELGHNICK